MANRETGAYIPTTVQDLGDMLGKDNPSPEYLAELHEDLERARRREADLEEVRLKEARERAGRLREDRLGSLE